MNSQRNEKSKNKLPALNKREILGSKSRTFFSNLNQKQKQKKFVSKRKMFKSNQKVGITKGKIKKSCSLPKKIQKKLSKEWQRKLTEEKLKINRKRNRNKIILEQIFKIDKSKENRKFVKPKIGLDFAKLFHQNNENQNKTQNLRKNLTENPFINSITNSDQNFGKSFLTAQSNVCTQKIGSKMDIWRTETSNTLKENIFNIPKSDQKVRKKFDQSLISVPSQSPRPAENENRDIHFKNSDLKSEGAFKKSGKKFLSCKTGPLREICKSPRLKTIRSYNPKFLSRSVKKSLISTNENASYKNSKRTMLNRNSFMNIGRSNYIKGIFPSKKFYFNLPLSNLKKHGTASFNNQIRKKSLFISKRESKNVAKSLMFPKLSSSRLTHRLSKQLKIEEIFDKKNNKKLENVHLFLLFKDFLTMNKNIELIELERYEAEYDEMRFLGMGLSSIVKLLRKKACNRLFAAKMFYLEGLNSKEAYSNLKVL